MEYARKRDSQGPALEQVFIIGGAQIYTQTLHRVDRMYLTLIHQEQTGDAYFPEYDPTLFQETSREDRTEPLSMSWITLDRIKPLTPSEDS
jgi:dihydrofolate reductase